VGGEAPARIVHEDDETLAFLPLEPATDGHTLVIPKQHVETFLDAEPGLLARVTTTAAALARVINDVVRPDGANLITSAGRAATQSVFHLHVHIVPRWDDDVMGDMWPARKPVPGERQDELAQRIRARLARSS
jgi:histidine triad (HIT) family protein